MKVYFLFSFAIFIFVSFVISSEDRKVKFLEEIEIKSNFAVQSSSLPYSSLFDNNGKNQHQIIESLKNNPKNKFENILENENDVESSYFECENLNPLLASFDEEIFIKLFKCLNSHLDSPITTDLVSFILMKVQKTARSNRLTTTIKFVYNNEEDLRFLKIFINKHTTSKLLINSLKISNPEFKNDKIFLFQADDDQNYYFAESLKNLPEIGQKEELINFMNHLEILFLKKNTEKYHKKLKLFTPKIYSSSDDTTNFLEWTFEKIEQAWGFMISRFHNSRETATKKLLVEKGFSKYDQSVHIQILGGMKRQGLGSFYDLIERRLEVPQDKRNYISSVLESIEWSDTNSWANFDIAFSIQNGADVKFASIFSNRGPNDRFNFVITEVNATFELAPDLIIITEKLSILGGLWSQQTFEVEKVPRNVSQEDIENVFNFFQLIVYKQVASQFGIDLPLPK